jgi:GNAT superfamily N-acetyltransferase
MAMRVGPVEPAATRELRRLVLRPHLAPDAPLPGDSLSAGVHIGATDDAGRVVGTCLVYPDPCHWLSEHPGAAHAWHLRQMATAPERRGTGIGSAVLAAAVEYVRARGAGLLWCHARESAVGFYARNGFTPHGELFIDAEHPIPHLRMYHELAGAEPLVPDTSS